MEQPSIIKPGDFIQLDVHFGDVFFEVVSCYRPSTENKCWFITYVTYDKYGASPTTSWSTTSLIRKIIPAEMAIPVMIKQGYRFKSKAGNYDPAYGYAPAGKALRTKE